MFSTTSLVSKYIPSNIGIPGSITGDMAFLGVVFILLIGLSYYFGRGFIVSLIVSFYPASILFRLFPFMEKVIFVSEGRLLVLNQIAVFLLFLIPITIIINRFIFTASDYSGGENILRLAGLSLAFLIIIVLFSYNTVNYDIFHNYSSQIDSIFDFPAREFYWMLAPLALLAIL